MNIFNRRFGTGSALVLFVLLTCKVFAQDGTWTTKAPMHTQRAGPTMAVADGILYAIGGGNWQDSLDIVEAYNQGTDTWTTKAPIPTGRSGAAAGAVDGIVYVVGGYLYDPYGGEILDSVEAYNPRTDTWTTKAPMLTPRVRLGVGVVDGILYAVGGHVPGVGATDTVEAYDPRTNTWSTKAPLLAPREALAVAVADGRLYAIGGWDRGSYVLTLEAYDPTTDTWSTQGLLPAPLGVGAGVIGGTIYAMGVCGVRTLEVYEPKTNTWTTSPPMPSQRCGFRIEAVRHVLYAVGGVVERQVFLTLNEAFSPFVHIGIDIRPGDPRNVINLNSAGTVPVAILGSATFDPTSVDPATVTLAGAPVATRGWGLPMTAQGDFNHDGYFDLLLHFRTQDLELTPTSTEAVLYATTFSGQRIRGADSVRLILPPGGGHSSTQAVKARKARQP